MPYIEREYLTEQFEDLLHNDNIMNPVIKVLDALEIIDTAPSANVVEVVRCKDCEFVQPTQIKLNGKDLKTCELYKRPCFDNDFCSRGVLKEVEG